MQQQLPPAQICIDVSALGNEISALMRPAARRLARARGTLLLAGLAVAVAACGGGGGGSASPATPPQATSPNPNASPAAPTLNSSQPSAYAGQSITFTGSATDANNLALTYTWDFGDGSNASGNNVTHSYLTAGVYNVRLTVTNSNGAVANGTLAQGIIANAPNALVADCAGANCAASNANTYDGTGTGVWRYRNTTATDAIVNVNIAGVSAGKAVTLLFSNGTAAAATSSPSTGVLAEPALAAFAAPAASFAPPTATGDRFSELSTQQSEATTISDQQDASHSQLLENNGALARGVRSMGPASGPSLLADNAGAPSSPRPLAAPAIDTGRIWNDLFDSTTNPARYPTTAKAVCAAGNGRSAVIWVDPNAEISGKVTPATVTAFSNTFCGDGSGNAGGFAQLVALMGGAWGSGAAAFSNLIPESTADSALQDINIVIVDPTTTPAPTWAGYFYGYNNFTAASKPNSNEALVFFINANSVSKSLNSTLSTLIHEATHMINFYQRSVVRGVTHDTWLEETTAMMSEDIVSPTVVKKADGSGYNKIAESRLPAYLRTGGAVSYINWPLLSSSNYAVGGAFGAYLNRRYGLSIFSQLLSNCSDGTTGNTSYTCLDTLIKNNGGQSFAEDYAHAGASLFALLPATGMPAFYGYPAKTDGGYALAGIDVSAFATLRPLTATPLSSGYTATTHTYKLDTVAPGKTSYVRNGVVVPANTTLIVVVR